jgi:hypothetical protein
MRTAVLATPSELAGVANVAQNARRRKSLGAGPASCKTAKQAPASCNPAAFAARE